MGRALRQTWWFACALLIGSAAVAEESTIVLFDFAAEKAAERWQIVNDDVMGGVSTSRFRITGDQTLEFTGKLSLANNGGFASVRSRASQLGFESSDAIMIRARGDGREYTLNLYVNRRRTAYSYRAMLPTQRDEWIDVAIPLDEFRATSFGNIVANAGPVKPEEISGVGFLLSDKQAGPFRLEVAAINILRQQ
jgi:monofunctional biosynthetic peptidoglycan transglycosylase